MRYITLLFVLGLATGAFSTIFDHDIKIKIYDVFRSLQVGVPLNYYIETLGKSGEVRFTEDLFRYYPGEIKDFVIAYKENSTDFLHGYYLRVGKPESFTSEQWKAVDRLRKYIQSDEYYVLTPLAAQKIAPDYFKAPLKYFHYDYFTDVDVFKPTPTVFLIPKSYFNEKSFETLLLIADFDISKEGVPSITELALTQRITRAPYFRTAAVYGEPTEFLSKIDKPIVYTSPRGYRLINTYKYDLPDFPKFRSPYHFENTYPYLDSLKSGYTGYPYYPFYTPYLKSEDIKDISWTKVV